MASVSSPEQVPGVPARLAAQEVLDVLRAAHRAPSIHNTQPWLFRPLPDGVEVLEDLRRALPASDPHGRDRLVSCGAAVRNAEVALARLGWRPRTALLPARSRRSPCRPGGGRPRRSRYGRGREAVPGDLGAAHAPADLHGRRGRGGRAAARPPGDQRQARPAGDAAGTPTGALRAAPVGRRSAAGRRRGARAEILGWTHRGPRAKEYRPGRTATPRSPSTACWSTLSPPSRPLRPGSRSLSPRDPSSRS